MGVFKKLILGWIQVDRMMVMCWKRSVDVIFDKNGYRGSLQDDLEDIPGNSFGYQNVGTGWGYGGIV